MAGKPLDGFADRVQYPLATPSKRCLRKKILSFVVESRWYWERIILAMVSIWESLLAGKLALASGKQIPHFVRNDRGYFFDACRHD